MTNQHWTNELIACRKAGSARTFILHGNVYDHQRNKRGKYLELCDYLAEMFIACRVMFYSISGGLRFAHEETEKWFRDTYLKSNKAPQSAAERAGADVQNKMAEAPLDAIFERSPDKALPFLEKVLATPETDRDGKLTNKKILVIEYAHNVAPAASGSSTNMLDRVSAETMQRWIRNTRFKEAGSSVILITPELAALAACVRSPDAGARTIRIARPNETCRREYWQMLIDEKGLELEENLDTAILARLSNGLSIRQIDTVALETQIDGGKLYAARLRKLKQEMLEAEFGGRVQVKMPEFGLEYLGGKKKLKEYFQMLATDILNGEYWALPMGIMAVGSPGTGKTFSFECLAHDCGIPVLDPGSLLSKWVGESEQLLERFLSLAYDMGPCFVLEDESDQSEAPRDAPNGDSGVSLHLRQMKFKFCSDPRNRGRVIWIRITNRDDLIDDAYKRKGRTDDNLCFLLPDEEESEDIFRVMFKRYNISRDAELTEFHDFAKKTAALIYCSGADIEWMVRESGKIARRAGRRAVSRVDLHTVVDSWEMDLNPDNIDRQTITAIRGSDHATRPDDWRERLAQAEERMRKRRGERAAVI